MFSIFFAKSSLMNIVCGSFGMNRTEVEIIYQFTRFALLDNIPTKYKVCLFLQ